MAQNLLTARAVETRKKRGRYSDGKGLVLRRCPQRVALTPKLALSLCQR
jgi:hypothetical protein